MRSLRKHNKRILLVIYGKITFGGVSIFLNNILSNMDKEGFVITLYAFGYVEEEAVFQNYIDTGVKVIVGNLRDYNRKRIAWDLFKIMFFKKFDIIHVNTGGLDLTYLSLLIAKYCGIKQRIAHSHAVKLSPKPYNEWEIKCQKRISKLATMKLSCSKQASEHLYGNPDAIFISNGISTNKFSFNPDIREKTRNELNLQGKYVIGDVGRLDNNKNQSFILDIANELKKYIDVSILLVGNGVNRDELEKKAEEMVLKNDTVFVAANDHVEYYLNALDVFIQPSHAEGLSISAVEAQAMDLPVWCSTAIPEQARITEKFYIMDLDEGAEAWAKQILDYLRNNDYENRRDRSEDVREKGFDIVLSAQKMRDIYLE